MFHVKLVNMEKIISCALCGNESFTNYLEPQDYFLTQEAFTIVKCKNCGLLFVNPRPAATEISKYYNSESYISHSTKQKGILDRVYSFIRRKNHVRKYTIISNYKKAGSILDIGCATGEFLNFFKNKGWQTTGLEPNEKARQFASQAYNLDVLDENDIQKLPDKKFDVVTMWHVLEHVHDINERIFQLDRILKDDGIAVIAVPNSKCYDASFYGKYWAGYDVPRHIFHFTTETLAKLFEKRNFKLLEKLPMVYDAYYISMISEKYKTGKKNLVKAFFHGFRSNQYAKRNGNEFSSLIYVFGKNGLK